MSSMSDSLSSRELRVEDLRWLRSLARSLVRDPALADDAVQDTLVRTLAERPRDPGALRGWLGAILRNVVRQGWRGRARRERREGARVSAASAPSTLDVVAELSLHRRLVEHVNALEEPYRTAIVMRFLRERPPHEAARELGVPLKTFHTHVERGLARLRERLGREREAWALLCALDPASPASIASRLTPLLLPMKLKTIALVLGLFLVGATWWRWGRADAPAPQMATLAEAPLAPPESFLEAAPAGGRASVAPVPGGTPSASTERIAEPEPPHLDGFVRSLDGHGLSDLRVLFEREIEKRFQSLPEDPQSRSGARGEFSIAFPGRPGRLTVEDQAYAALIEPHLDGGAAPLAPPIVVVAPARDYDGSVVDEAGLAVAGATVEVTLGGSFVQSLEVGDVSLHLLLPFAEAKTDEAGEFRFAHVGTTAGAILAVQADGFVPREVALPELSTSGLEVVLVRRTDTARTIHGLVLDAGGRPCESAQVSLGDATVASDELGRFALEWEEWRTQGWLQAVKPGTAPAALALDEALLASTPEAPVVLQLGAEPRSIRGRVLDAEGRPVAGALVFSPDSTPFGSVVIAQGEHSLLGGTTVEALLTGRAGPWEATMHVETDEAGGFELGGLLERHYALFALDPRDLSGSGRVDVLAGETDARLVLAPVELHAVAGRVLSRRGVPLADVQVSVGRSFPWLAREPSTTSWTPLPARGPDAAWTLSAARARTDTEGRFELAPLAVAGTFLRLSGQAITLGETVVLERAGALDALEIRVDASSRFEVVLANPDEAAAFSLATLDGDPLPLFVEVDGATISAPSVDLVGGRSAPVLATEGEWVLVLHSGEREVRRETLTFPAGGLHELRP